MELQARSEKSFTSSAVPSTSSSTKSGEDLQLKMQEVLSQVATVKAQHQAGKVANGTSNTNKDPRRHSIPSTSSAPNPHSQHPSQHSHHPGYKQDPHCGHAGQSGVESWKRMPNPIGWDVRKTLFRVHGICKEVPEHNVTSVRDPRIQKYRSHVMMDLPVPYFLIDDDYTAVPTNREFSVTGLNDNDFNSHAESAAFIKKYNGKTIMGSIVQCFFDPLAYKISKLFEEKTGGNFPSLPARYVHLSSVRTIWRIRQMLQKFYGERDEAELPVTSKKVVDNEVIVLEDDEKVEKSPSPPPYDRIPVTTPSPTKNVSKSAMVYQNSTPVTTISRPIFGSPTALTSKNAPTDSFSTSTFGSAKHSTYDLYTISNSEIDLYKNEIKITNGPQTPPEIDEFKTSVREQMFEDTEKSLDEISEMENFDMSKFDVSKLLENLVKIPTEIQKMPQGTTKFEKGIVKSDQNSGIESSKGPMTPPGSELENSVKGLKVSPDSTKFLKEIKEILNLSPRKKKIKAKRLKLITSNVIQVPKDKVKKPNKTGKVKQMQYKSLTEIVRIPTPMEADLSEIPIPISPDSEDLGENPLLNKFCSGESLSIPAEKRKPKTKKKSKGAKSSKLREVSQSVKKCAQYRESMEFGSKIIKVEVGKKLSAVKSELPVTPDESHNTRENFEKPENIAQTLAAQVLQPQKLFLRLASFTTPGRRIDENDNEIVEIKDTQISNSSVSIITIADSTVPTPNTPFFTPMAPTPSSAFAYGKTPPPPPLPNLPPITLGLFPTTQSHAQFGSVMNDTKLPLVVPPPPPPLMQNVKLDHSRNANVHNDDARSTPTYSTSSQEDSPPTDRKASKKLPPDCHGKRTSRFNKVEPEAISVSESESDKPAAKPSNKQNKSSKKKSSSRASTRSDHSQSDRRRYRWSSDSTESSTGSKISESPSPPPMGTRSIAHGSSIPPPALINPPTPVGLAPKPSSQQEKSPSTSNSSQTTPKKSGLEERLNQLFFKAHNQKSVSQTNIKLEDAKIKPESAADKNHNSRDAGKTPRNSQRQENSFTVQPSTSKIPSLLDLPLLRAMKQEIVKDQPQEAPEPKEMTEEDRIAKERQEKIHKCMDVSKRARTLIHRELLICVQNDIKRRLEQEAFRLLDEQWQAMLEEKKRQEKENELEVKIIGTTAPSNKENSLLSTLFPSFESATNAEESMLPNESIFGIPYTVRMANLPSFKKKKPIETKRQSSNSSVFSRARLQKNASDRKRKIETDEESEHRGKNSFQYSAVKNVDKFDSPMVMSLVTSADEAEPISESEDENEQVKTEKEIEQEIERSIMQRKRAILDICLKESRHAEEAGDSSPIASSITPCSSVQGDTIDSPGTPKPIAIAAIEAGVENQEYSQVSADSKPPTPSDAKAIGAKSKPKVHSNRELAALLGSDFVVPYQVTTKKEPKLWAKRNEEEEERLLYEFQKVGICQEDCAYIKLIYNSTKFREIVPEELRSKLPWIQPNFVPRPEELPTPLKRDNCEFYYNDPELEGIVPHKTGCARTEGYYKIEKQRKRVMRRHDDCSNRTIISTQDETAIRHMTQASKDERAMNRRLLTWIGDNSLLRVNQLKYRSKMIKFARSRIHGWGLYALENIAPEEMIIEYVGEKVRPTVADEREKSYERRGMGSSYMFRIDGDAVIDATKMGNHGRFINHSCNPNCTARVVTVDGDKRIVIYSKRLIEKGEEITYDYKFAREEEASKIECLCGARCCQKYLN
ncbi:SET domain-containing protein [Ditylenchus destructor]|uniref:[histone H3]-lysine(4) N-trimethyltransferase n=1 Tax=Ditylenchus destructor TaxID=166010 RepID=A0AAD4QWW3_9BILA|nr:SET domain-containing protein [Ditylenchus destructor]